MNKFKLNNLVQTVENGGIIAYPTESVFGLGCDPFNYFTVARILQIKRRSERKGLIIVAASVVQLYSWVQNIPPEMWQQITNSVATNWILPKSNLVPCWISGQHHSIAVRISHHPIVRQICLALDSPIVSTSANISGRPALRNVISVRKNFGCKIDLIVNGVAGGIPPCKIINPFTKTIIRN